MSNKTVSVGSYNVQSFIQILNDGKDNGGHCQLGGLMAGNTMVLFDKMRSAGYGCVLEEYDKIGNKDVKTGQYSGLIGGLNRNHIQYIAMPVYYPFEDETGNIEMSPPFLEDTMSMVSMYNVTDGRRIVDMSYMYQSIPTIFWIGLFMSLICLSMTFGAGVKIRHRVLRTPTRRRMFDSKRMMVINQDDQLSPGRAIWIMIGVFLSQPNFPRRRTMFMTIIVLASAFPIFFIMIYINNTVGTDLVIVDKPVTISSYQDVIDKDGVRVLMSNQYAETEKFASAPKDSIQGKLYQRRQIYSQVPNGDQVMRQDAVVLGRGFLVDCFSAISMTMLREHQNLRALRTVDAAAKKYTNVFIGRSDAPIEVRIAFQKGVVSLVESGLVNYVYDLGPRIVVADIFGSASMSIFEKISSKVEEQKFDPVPISLSNIQNMIRFYLILIVINLVCLLSEISYHNLITKWRKRKEFESKFVWHLER